MRPGPAPAAPRGIPPGTRPPLESTGASRRACRPSRAPPCPSSPRGDGCGPGAGCGGSDGERRGKGRGATPLAGGRCRGFGVWHCGTAQVGVCPLRLAGHRWHRALQHCGLPVLRRAPASTAPDPPAPACRGRAGSRVWCEWVPTALEPSQTTAEAGGSFLRVFFFFLEKRQLCSALPLPWARGSSGAEQRILVLRGQPCASGYRAAAETRSGSEVWGASAHRLGGQCRSCVRPRHGRFFSINTQDSLGTFGLCWFWCFFNKTFKLNLVRWCQQPRRGSHPTGRTLLGFFQHGRTPCPLCKWQLGRGVAGSRRSPGRGSVSAQGAAASHGPRPCQGWAVWAGQARAEPGTGASPRACLPGAALVRRCPRCPGAAGLWCQLAAPQGGSPLVGCCRLWGSCIPPLLSPWLS